MMMMRRQLLEDETVKDNQCTSLGLSYHIAILSLLGRFRLTLQTTSETQSDSQRTAALYFSSIAKPSDLLMQEHVIEWLGSLLLTYLTNVCSGLLTPSDIEMPSSAPKNKKYQEAWIAIKRSQPMPGNTTRSHYRYNRLASFLLADRAQKLKLKYAFLPI